MSRYRKVDVRMWNDRNVRALTPPPPCGQSLWVRLLTGPETGIVPGVFEATEEGLAAKLKWPLEGFREAFREVSGEAYSVSGKGSPKALAKADWEAGLVWVPNAIKRNAPQSPNVVKSWSDPWDILPECDLKDEAYWSLRAFVKGMGEGFGKAFEKALPKPYGKPCANQEQEQEQEQDRPSGERTRAAEPWRQVGVVYADRYTAETGRPLAMHLHEQALRAIALAAGGDMAMVEKSLSGFWADPWAKQNDWPPSAWAKQFGRHLNAKPSFSTPAPHDAHPGGEIAI